jgi:hypothetical protein
MPASTWLSKALCALAALGLIVYRTTPTMAQDQDEKKPSVIILRLLTETTEKEQEKEEGKANAEDDEDNDDDKKKDDVKKKTAKREAAKKKTKAPKQEKSDRAAREGENEKPRENSDRPPVIRRDGPGEFEFRLREPQSGERAREDRPNREREEQGNQFRWEGEAPRGPGREEGRGGPPDRGPDRGPADRGRPDEEMRRQMERQRVQMEQQRAQMQRQAEEIRERSEQMRREFEERAQRPRVSPEELQQLERKNRELAERLEGAQRQLEDRSREVEKLHMALKEREQAIAELKKMLAAHHDSAKGEAKPADKQLAARVEKIEAEIKRMMTLLKQAQQKPALKAEPKPTIKLQRKPKPQEKQIEKLGGGKPKVENSDGGTLVIGGQIIRSRAAVTKPVPKPAPSPNGNPNLKPNLESSSSEVPPPTPLPDPDAIVPASKVAEPAPFVAVHTAAALGGVGVVEGDVVALLPQENKVVLKVASWNDGKQLRSDWVGQQVAIVRSGMPNAKVGDRISIDARIDSKLGFVWGGKIFSSPASK